MTDCDAAPDSPSSTPDTETSISRRRALFATGSVLAAVSLAGCGGIDDGQSNDTGDGASDDSTAMDDRTAEDGTTEDGSDDGSSGDDDGGDGESDDERIEDPTEPVEVVEAYFNALSDGDLARAEELLLADGPLASQLTDDPEEFAANAETTDIEFLEGSVIDREGDEYVVVETSVTVSSDGKVQPRTLQLELRRENDRWRIWGQADEVVRDIELPDVEGAPVAVLRTYLDGYTTGDRETLESAIHPDSPRQQSLDETDDERLNRLDGIISDYRLESVTVAEQTDDRLVLDVTTTVIAVGETNDESGTVEMRTYEGEWRVWEEDVLS